MKNIKLVFMSLLAVAVFSCKDGKKENNSEHDDGVEHLEKEGHDDDKAMFALLSDSTKVSFTAYKTTEKKPVGGIFKTINVSGTNSGSNYAEVLNGAKFNIPVSSLFTNDATNTRDPKLLEFFFGMMKDTELISGVLKAKDNSCSIDVTLNGETANIPLTVEKTGDNSYVFSGTMNLENWKALDAVASLHKACEALHTGADGVSKTWNDVAVKAEIQLKKN